MMRRRADIGLDQFRRHWLDPHGVMTAGLPGVRYYIQSHCLDAPGTNALARELAIDGLPQLWFDSIEARPVATVNRTRPRPVPRSPKSATAVSPGLGAWRPVMVPVMTNWPAHDRRALRATAH